MTSNPTDNAISSPESVGGALQLDLLASPTIAKNYPSGCFECGSKKDTYKSITGKTVCTSCAMKALNKANDLFKKVKSHD